MHHFLKVTDFTLEQAQEVFSLAKSLKDDRFNTPASLNKQSWGLLFYKSSTRTRVSFEVGVNELGGFPIVLNSQNTQIGRGETVEDSSKVLSRYLHGLVIRAYEHEVVTEFAKHATMPIINGLTDFNHPCQLYTDIFTLLERYSPDAVDINTLKGKKVAFLGDSACNMANSWILTAAMLSRWLCCVPADTTWLLHDGVGGARRAARCTHRALPAFACDGTARLHRRSCSRVCHTRSLRPGLGGVRCCRLGTKTGEHPQGRWVQAEPTSLSPSVRSPRGRTAPHPCAANAACDLGPPPWAPAVTCAACARAPCGIVA